MLHPKGLKLKVEGEAIDWSLIKSDVRVANITNGNDCYHKVKTKVCHVARTTRVSDQKYANDASLRTNHVLRL